jgi:hypothetical protein
MCCEDAIQTTLTLNRYVVHLKGLERSTPPVGIAGLACPAFECALKAGAVAEAKLAGQLNQ